MSETGSAPTPFGHCTVVSFGTPTALPMSGFDELEELGGAELGRPTTRLRTAKRANMSPSEYLVTTLFLRPGKYILT